MNLFPRDAAITSTAVIRSLDLDWLDDELTYLSFFAFFFP